ncbi:MAG: UxaA family hydrolase [Anaerolineae bacterium]|nr:UxaA family hydrolase [Anaerolineae bacterium]
MKKVFVVEKADNVGTAVGEVIKAGETVGAEGRITQLEVVVNADIPYGHKVAIRPIAKGEQVMKYGLSIGTAIEDIRVGDHVHIHNVESNRGRGDKFEAEPDCAE